TVDFAGGRFATRLAKREVLSKQSAQCRLPSLLRFFLLRYLEVPWNILAQSVERRSKTECHFVGTVVPRRFEWSESNRRHRLFQMSISPRRMTERIRCSNYYLRLARVASGGCMLSLAQRWEEGFP